MNGDDETRKPPSPSLRTFFFGRFGCRILKLTCCTANQAGLGITFSYTWNYSLTGLEQQQRSRLESNSPTMSMNVRGLDSCSKKGWVRSRVVVVVCRSIYKEFSRFRYSLAGIIMVVFWTQERRPRPKVRRLLAFLYAG